MFGGGVKMAVDEKQKALEVAILQIEKQFGKGSIMKMGEADTKMNIDVIPTGAITLDLALGVGGIPGFQVIEITDPNHQENHRGVAYGAEVQNLGIAAFIDAEHALIHYTRVS